MHFKQNPKQQKSDLKYYIWEGITWAIMYYIGVVFLVPYLINLKASTLEIGLLTTLPIFVSSFFVLFSYDLLKYFKSEKHFILFFTLLQAIFWIPLALVGYFFDNHFVVWIVIIFHCLIIIMEQLPFAVYREWIGKVFNASKIVEYNSRKQIVLNVISIFPLLFAGVIFDLIEKNIILGFTIIFIIAGIFRFGSYLVMRKMSQTENNKDLCLISKKMSKPTFSAFKEVVLNNKQFLYFLIIVSLIYFSMYISTPFYRYYFLEILKFSYKQYVFLEIGSILGLVFSFYYWGKICDKYGSTKVLKAIILFLPIYPFLVILFNNNVWLLFSLNLLDGALMAGLTLGIYGYFYQNIKFDMIRHMSFFLIFQSFAMLLGTLLGGIIASNPVLWLYGVEKYGLFLIFIISIVFRLFTIGFISKIKDTNKNNINLPKSIILQKPLIFGLYHFLNFTKVEGKLVAKEIKKEQKELKKELIKQGKTIEKNIQELANKEKEIFEKITNIESQNQSKRRKKKAL